MCFINNAHLTLTGIALYKLSNYLDVIFPLYDIIDEIFLFKSCQFGQGQKRKFISGLKIGGPEIITLS